MIRQVNKRSNKQTLSILIFGRAEQNEEVGVKKA
jgi:hypothetical protein